MKIIHDMSDMSCLKLLPNSNNAIIAEKRYMHPINSRNIACFLYAQRIIMNNIKIIKDRPMYPINNLNDNTTQIHFLCIKEFVI